MCVSGDISLTTQVLSFSTGPVAISDAINASNKSLIMRACDSSGRLLRPDRPAVELDQIFVSRAGLVNNSNSNSNSSNTNSNTISNANADATSVWSTFAVVDGQRYSYLLVPRLTAQATPFRVTLCELGYAPCQEASATTTTTPNTANNTTTNTTTNATNNETKLVAWTLRGGVTRVQTVDARSPLTLAKPTTPEDPEVVVLSPILDNGFAVLGEPSKWVSVSPQRFERVQIVAGNGNPRKAKAGVASGIEMRMSGGIGEVVVVAVRLPDSSVVQATCTLSRAGAAVLHVDATGETQCTHAHAHAHAHA